MKQRPVASAAGLFRFSGRAAASGNSPISTRVNGKTCDQPTYGNARK
jgi:hypothetical protein